MHSRTGDVYFFWGTQSRMLTQTLVDLDVGWYLNEAAHHLAMLVPAGNSWNLPVF